MTFTVWSALHQGLPAPTPLTVHHSPEGEEKEADLGKLRNKFQITKPAKGETTIRTWARELRLPATYPPGPHVGKRLRLPKTVRHSKRGISIRKKTWSSSLTTASTVRTCIPIGPPTRTPSPEFQNTGHPFSLTTNSYSTCKAQPELPLLRSACRFPLSHWLSQLPGLPERPGYTVRQRCAGLSSSSRLRIPQGRPIPLLLLWASQEYSVNTCQLNHVMRGDHRWHSRWP